MHTGGVCNFINGGGLYFGEPMNQSTIITHAVLIGLTPLIPIPFLDDLVKSFFYKRLVRALAARYSLVLNNTEINLLSEDRSRGLLKGCLLGTVEYIVKRLIRKLIIVLEWHRAIDTVTQAYYAGYLMDYAFQQGWYAAGDPAQAMRLRAAIDTARKDANLNLVRNIVKSSFNQSRGLVLDAVRQISFSLKDIAFRRSRLWFRRRKQAAAVEEAVAEKMEGESVRVKGTLSQLISTLQEYLDILLEEHAEHFEGLQERLRVALQPAR